MLTTLPSDLLRTFVEVIDTGSMLRASERVLLTPSAVSLQIKRLEEITNCVLFYRDRRKLVLTSEGETLEGYARQILELNREALDMLGGERATGLVRLGIVEDFARTLLTGTLRRFAALNPDAHVQLRVSGSRELKELVAAGRLDLALIMTLPSEEDVVARRPVFWFGQEHLSREPVIPLAMLEEPCLFRSQAIAALQQAGLPYEITIETASVSALQAAVTAGLGITTRIGNFIQGEGGGMSPANLPVLPEMGYSLIQAPKGTRSIRTLRTALESSLSDL